MGNVITYTNCPVCEAAGISKTFSVKDNSVSQEVFEIYHCASCQLRFTQNVPDHSLIGKYYKSENYISHTDIVKGLVNRTYRFIRNIANRQKKNLIERVSGIKKGTLLDIGSGTGYFVAEMKNSNWEVTGLEPDTGARKIALEINNVSLSPIEKYYQLPAKNYDVITLWHVLEHVHDLKKYVAHFKSLLKENGVLLVAVPNYRSLDAEIYKEYWAAYDVPRHLYHFSPDAMKRLMDMEGFKIVEMRPMWFDSFYVSLLSSKYKHGNTNWIGAIWTAFRSNLKAMKDHSHCSSVIYIMKVKH